MRKLELMTTTENLHSEIKIKNYFPMVQITQTIEISKKGIIRSIFEKVNNEYQEAYDALIHSAPNEANAIIGIKHSTCTHQFNDRALMYLTYIGTPVTIES